MEDQSRYLVVGLGNPGLKYEQTFHNCGWFCIDALVEATGIQLNRQKFQGIYGSGEWQGKTLYLLKPLTFMNLSGDSVRPLADYFKIPISNIGIIYDDVDIELGQLRIREKGGPGTHNGMKSVIDRLGQETFPRFRIGIGPKPAEWDMISYVLAKIPPDKQALLAEVMEDVVRGVKLWLKRDIQFAMNRVNVQRKTNRQADRADSKKERDGSGKKSTDITVANRLARGNDLDLEEDKQK
ncbi:MAG TPA: aminoacyl-tRNA hydrolase [Clostridiaceae bacterium]|nr:aminoacyl-tRNA hydrolase [Clostridiaceae bacterium]